MATALALIAFAANSVFCRLALGSGAIDANHFTEIRLFSGALVLWLICKTGPRKNVKPTEQGWLSPLYLFVYAFTFSLAYVSLETGTGALILFAAVQMTMVAGNLLRGQPMNRGEWTGMALAFGGFVYLILPGVSAPPITGFLLMAVSGIAWGLYTLRGQSSSDPLVDTGRNFMRALVFVMILA
ncbi:MAG: EamA family transporter, partial [Fidelibacterota bacterium]